MTILDKHLADAKRGLEDETIKANKWLYETFSGMIARYSYYINVGRKNRVEGKVFKLVEVTFNHGEKQRQFGQDTFGTGYELLSYTGKLGAAVVRLEAPDGFGYVITYYGPVAYIQRYKGKDIISVPDRTLSIYNYFEPEVEAIGEIAAKKAGEEWMNKTVQNIQQLTEELDAAALLISGSPAPEWYEKKKQQLDTFIEKYREAVTDQKKREVEKA